MTTPAAIDSTRHVSGRAWMDVAVLTVLSMIGIVGLATSFQDLGYLLAGVGGLVVGTGVAILAHYLRLGPVPTVIAAVLAYFLFGSALAARDHAFLGVLPSLESLSDLAIGAVFGWRDILTLQAPVELPDYVTAVPYVAAWVVALVGTTLAVRWLPTRTRTAWRASLLLIGPALLYLASILLGTEEPYYPGVRGIAFAVLALVWLGWRRGQRLGITGNRALLRRKILGTGAIVLSAALVGALAGAALAPAPSNRFVLREQIEPPFEPLDYASPFAGFRKYTKLEEDTKLFTVSGLQEGELVRLATLDTYDGVLWGVAGAEVSTGGSGSFSLVSKKMPKPPLVTPGDPSNVSFDILDYSDVWVPSVGYPSALSLGDADASNLRYNAATGTAVLTTGLSAGKTYRVTAITQKVPSDEELEDVPVASIQLPPVSNIPDVLTARAAELIGDATSPIDKLRSIETVLKTTGFLSHGTASDSVSSRAGQGADRMSELFTRSQMIGDEEQYASAFALMARSMNYPARVVMGFKPVVTDGGGTVTVLGSDVTAWVEVAFEGVGWVPFFPTPDDTDIPQDQTPKPQTEPQPQVRQPPRSDPQQDDLITAVDIDDSDSDDGSLFGIPGWVFVVGISLAIPLAIYFVPLLVIAAMKRRRAGRRRTADAGDSRVAGAWDELVDQYSELGYAVAPRTTRRGVASGLAAQLPAEGGSALAGIATSTDEAVFSGREIDAAQSETVWTEAMAAVAIARDAAPRFRRFMSRFRINSAKKFTERLIALAAAEAERRRK
ncbi:MAG: transglutaminaseTgpA domain-containing protein [Rhodoglobus sp.]